MCVKTMDTKERFQFEIILNVLVGAFRFDLPALYGLTYRRLLIGRDGHLDQSEAYDIS